MSLCHHDSSKLVKRSTMIHRYEGVLYKEPVGVRQLVGLCSWNKLLAKQNIPKSVLKEMNLGSSYRKAVSESESSEDVTNSMQDQVHEGVKAQQQQDRKE